MACVSVRIWQISYSCLTLVVLISDHSYMWSFQWTIVSISDRCSCERSSVCATVLASDCAYERSSFMSDCPYERSSVSSSVHVSHGSMNNDAMNNNQATTRRGHGRPPSDRGHDRGHDRDRNRYLDFTCESVSPFAMRKSYYPPESCYRFYGASIMDQDHHGLLRHVT